MTLRLYDSMTRALREFEPTEAGRASIYLCGATVQSAPHIGHVRSNVSFDIVRRWLAHRGYDVTFVRNVTDIDDKILAKAADNDMPWWAWAAINERAFDDAYAALGCLPPTLSPRATGHITEMVELMAGLIDGGHAYAVDGDVYFDVASYPAYGALSGQKPAQMQAAGDSVGDARKRNPRDFALWKSAKPGEPSWPTPWGPGRPGWHLECSAMAGKYLGDEFDIHGGGMDLIFPHHENEIAQSVAAGKRFARYWLHNAWVTLAGEKMSKSLGNGLLVSELLHNWRPVELRYYLGAAHYRSTIDFSEDALAEAAKAYGRVENFIERAVGLLGMSTLTFATPGSSAELDDQILSRFPLPKSFVDAMDEDFGVPGALAVVHETVRRGNAALAAGQPAAVDSALLQVVLMLDALGLNPLAWPTSAGDLTPVVDSLVSLALEQRTQARARKDYAAADAVRDQLATAGVDVEDTPDGPRWTVRPKTVEDE